jgi:hypothetical protein
MSQEDGGVIGELEKFGLSSGIAKGLAGIIGTITISVSDTGACQYTKGREVLTKIADDKNLYKYLPAIIFPKRVTLGYINTYQTVQNPTYFNISEASKLQSILIRHGLLVSTQKDGQNIYLYVGALPEGLQYTNRLTVAQGGVKFTSKPYKTIFNKANINPKFGIIPVSKAGIMSAYSTNPSINQGNSRFLADIVGIFNYMTSTLFHIWLDTSYSQTFNNYGNYYAIDFDLEDHLVRATSAKFFADTPAIHIKFVNNLIAPSIPDSVNFNPILNGFGTLSGATLNKAIIGSPVYVTSTQIPELCTDLQLRGFVSDIDVIAQETVVDILGNQIRLSPGLSFGGIINPPNSWSYDDLVSWAINNGMGLTWDDFNKWIDLVLFESEVVQRLVNRGYDYLTDVVRDYFDPAPEVVEKGVDNVVNGIVNAVSSGVSSVINFLSSL